MSVQSEENETESITTDIDENINAAIDKEIEKEIAEIKAGRHPNLLQATESLEHAKEKKIHAADRHRKMQIKNINALYEYEVEDANALYKVRFCSQLEVGGVAIDWIESKVNTKNLFIYEYLDVYRKLTLSFRTSSY